jgi:hypothetical protein
MIVPPVPPVVVGLVGAAQQRVLAPAPPASAVIDRPPMPTSAKEGAKARDNRDRDVETVGRRRRRRRGDRADLSV